MMPIGRPRQVEQFLQEALRRRAPEQVATADDVGDADGGIVDHRCQMIGRGAVAPAQHRVAEGAGDGTVMYLLQFIDQADLAWG